MPFAREISAVIARSVLGEIRSFPIAENVHRRHILHTTRAPAQLTPEAARQVADIALTIAEALGHIGVLAVEMFELAGLARCSSTRSRRAPTTAATSRGARVRRRSSSSTSARCVGCGSRIRAS